MKECERQYLELRQEEYERIDADALRRPTAYCTVCDAFEICQERKQIERDYCDELKKAEIINTI